MYSNSNHNHNHNHNNNNNNNNNSSSRKNVVASTKGYCSTSSSPFLPDVTNNNNHYNHNHRKHKQKQQQQQQQQQRTNAYSYYGEEDYEYYDYHDYHHHSSPSTSSYSFKYRNNNQNRHHHYHHRHYHHRNYHHHRFNGGANSSSSSSLSRRSSSSSTANKQSATTTTIISTSDYSKLPNVILTKIFSHLSMRDRLNASLACRSWRVGLFDPCLWHNIDLTIYICNRQTDIESAYFKLNNFARFAQSCSIKYNPNDACMIGELAKVLEFFCVQRRNNLKRLSLEPIYSYYDDDDEDEDEDDNSNENNDDNAEDGSMMITETCDMSAVSRRIFGCLNELISSSSSSVASSCLKSIEHLALGCLAASTSIVDNDNYYGELIQRLAASKHGQSLKSLHISTIKHAKSLSLATSATAKNTNNNNNNNNNEPEAPRNMNNYFNNSRLALNAFTQLTALSIDYEHLSDDLLLNESSCFQTTMRNLSINVNDLFNNTNSNTNNNNNNNNNNSHIRDETWSFISGKNPNLKVKVNFLMAVNTSNNYKYILNATMPLDTLRMYFCRALNPALLHYLSDNYSSTLKSLCVVDSIDNKSIASSSELSSSSASNRHHHRNNHNHNQQQQQQSNHPDPDPDPLVLLCWKCRHLSELVVCGYEILEINLIAIAKLRTNLKLFYVPMDCIIDLTYGKFRNDDFIEDEDGEDALVDYGACSRQVIDKVQKILNSPNWHPLEKDELPMCVYDKRIAFEEAFLDTLINDQNSAAAEIDHRQ